MKTVKYGVGSAVLAAPPERECMSVELDGTLSDD